jgi:hypothetical protein
MRRENLIHLLRHSEERIMRCKNLIIENIYKERNKKVRSSRIRKAKLRDGALLISLLAKIFNSFSLDG